MRPEVMYHEVILQNNVYKLLVILVLWDLIYNLRLKALGLFCGAKLPNNYDMIFNGFFEM